MVKLAPGPSFALASGSCMDQEVANKRLAISAAYLQAVLEESRLHKNADVQAFLDQGRVRARACAGKLSWASTTTLPGQQHAAATPAVTQEISIDNIAVLGQALPGISSGIEPPAREETIATRRL